MRLAALVAAFTFSFAAHAQWQMLDSRTTADLRGIDNVGKGIVWASGTNGTILRSEDAGYMWQVCAKPPGGEKLDFRGIQAFDANTAIAMSSGPGDQSRLYKTTDGCRTWKLVFSNPDKEGFWDAIAAEETYPPANPSLLAIVGDPVRGSFPVFFSLDRGSTWARYTQQSIRAKQGEAIFAASNSSLLPPLFPGGLTIGFVSGGQAGAYLHATEWKVLSFPDVRWQTFRSSAIPIGSKAGSSGAFSVASGCKFSGGAKDCPLVVVGGDYTHPEVRKNTAAYAIIPAHSQRSTGFHVAVSQPHGYRSAVAYDAQAQAWITVGPNGTDVSFDDGRNWHPLTPGPQDPPDADKNWNALSLPFVVGPHGRIGMLRENELAADAKRWHAKASH